MRWRPTTSQGLLRLAAAITSIVGLASAIWIYFTAGAAPGNPLGYDPEDSKRYLRDLERYGGKAKIVAGEITDWVNGLWHGRSLAFFVAWVAPLPPPPTLLSPTSLDPPLLI